MTSMNGETIKPRAGTDEPELGVLGTKLSGEAPAPEWIELIPPGDFNGRDGRGPFRLSNPGEVIRATTALKLDAGLPIDYDHATDFGAPEGRPAPAAGWISAFEERDGAIWGKVDWTGPGADAVATHEYRYVSPVFEYAGGGEVVRLLRAGLTNNPNLYLTAISAKVPREAAAAPMMIPSGGKNDPKSRFETVLREVLGLSAEAAQEEIIAEARRLTSAPRRQRAGEEGAVWVRTREAQSSEGEADPARYVPLAQFEQVLTELNLVRAERIREQAEQVVNGAMREGRLAPSQRDWAMTYCQADSAGFAKFVARQSPLISIANRPRGSEGLAGAGTSHERLERDQSAMRLTAIESAVCRRLGIKPADYANLKANPADLSAF